MAPRGGAVDEIEKLRVALQRPTFRRSFYDDAFQALQEEGIDASVIPDGLITTLRGLSVHELGLVARVTHELEVEGLVGHEGLLQIPL